MTETVPGVLEWGVATLAIAGEEESGDLHVVQPRDGGALVAAIDGLGHGPDAALAARHAAEAVARRQHTTLTELFNAAHEACRRTRGVVMSAAMIDARRNRLAWVGVGNIEATLLRTDGARHETIMLFGGIAGHQLPNIRPSTAELRAGDVLVFATDGVGSEYATKLDLRRPPQELADQALRNHNKLSDDALVLVARYTGGRA